MKNLLTKLFQLAPVLSLAGTLSGCATMFCGTSEDVKIESFPSGASVFVNGEFVGKTPVDVSMNRDSHPLLVLKKDGYADTRVRIEDEWNGMTMLNALFFPGIPFGFPITGWIIDTRSGATREYAEEHVVIPLLAEDAYQGVFYGGNVKVTNFNPSESVLMARDVLMSSLSEFIRDNLEDVRVQKDSFYNDVKRSRLSYRPEGTVWMQVEVGEDGKISSFSCLRVEGHFLLEGGATKTLQQISKSFVAPDESAMILPASVIIPVVYSNEK